MTRTRTLTILLILTFTSLNTWAGPASLASALLKSAKRMGLFASELAPQNARILADGIEALRVDAGDLGMRDRLLGLLRRDAITADDWSTEDIDVLARLAHRYTDPQRTDVFPYVGKLNRDRETIELQIISDPTVLDIAQKRVTWHDRSELISTLQRELPRLEIEGSLQYIHREAGYSRFDSPLGSVV